jgi:hypothetical protein
MSFQLTIAEGREAGKEFVFDQDSVVIGRVSACDVVLLDQGVSRRHCRIFREGERYVVEDLGSSNGTQVNGKEGTKHPLSDGDKLTLGPVVFAFKLVAQAPAMDEEPPTQAAGQNSTRIVSIEEMKQRRSRNRGVALVPEGMGEEEMDAAQRSATQAMPALKPRTSTRNALPAGGSAPRPSALERAAAGAPPARRATGGAELARPAPAPAGQGGALSAAERARIRRQSSGPAAQFKLFWLEASPGVRSAIFTLCLVMALGLMGGVYWLVLGGDQQVVRGPEPDTLSGRTIEDSFGLGNGVTWDRPDMKVFQWEYTAATRAMALLHFQAQGISEGEVVVTVNGVDVGKVPADTLASQDRSLEIMIPAQLLKKGEPNSIAFDNAHNPPAEDPWRIWNIRLEKVLLPEIPPEQLQEEARVAYTRGRKNLETAAVGARNRYEAWKSFREAWLMLEAHPEPKPDLYYEARERVKEAQRELDSVCRKLLLEVEGYANQKNWQAASATLDHVREYFPDDYDQPCARMAEQKRYDLGL